MFTGTVAALKMPNIDSRYSGQLYMYSATLSCCCAPMLEQPVADAVGALVELLPRVAAVALDLGGGVGERVGDHFPHIGKVPSGHGGGYYGAALMKLLVIGGTMFLGRHIVDAALAGGHDVTLANRGKTNADLYPDVEQLVVDRDSDISALSRASGTP